MSNNAGTQTKQHQQEKRDAFNKERVQWFDEYMHGERPFLHQMHISLDKNKTLTKDEQNKLAYLIQAGICGKIMQYKLAQKEGREDEILLQKTIIGDKEQILEMLEKIGWTTTKFRRNSKARKQLDKIVDDAWNARDLFAEKNLGLVSMVAGRRKRTGNGAVVDMDELMAEGMGGLMVAIDHFNPSLGNMFSTPAAWWIDQPIRNYLDSKTKTIHMPTHMNNIYKSIHYATKALRDQGYNDEDITDEKIVEYCQNKGRTNVTLEKIKDAREFRRETVSYDVPFNEGKPNNNNNKTLAELIESTEDLENDIITSIESQSIFNKIVAMVEDDKKREILRDWYTTDEIHDVVILSNISRKHCLTKERVRQLKAEAEKELKQKLKKLAKQQKISMKDALIEL